jgi:hypothetical protein
MKSIDKSVVLTPKQIDIYNGLRSIGEEIAVFFLDGVKILNNNNLETKSYLLAHIAREIEGGLRDILVGIEGVSHIDSICNALGVNKEDSFAKRWHKIAKEFHKYAHRHGPWKTPREKSEFENLWKEFEEILFQLVGTYYNLLDRIDHILKYEKPSEGVLETLPNLLRPEARYSYFFRKLQSPYWLKPLKEKGYFNPQSCPQEVWIVLGFIENVANKNMKEPDEEITNILIEIVNSIINYKDENGERIDNYQTDWIILKIISTFPIKKIEKEHIEFIRNALKSKGDNTLIASEIGETVIQKLINDRAKSLLLELLAVILDYKKVKGVSEDEYESIMDDYWLSDALKKHKLGIAGLCGIQSASIALKPIKAIIKEDESQFDNVWIPAIEDHPQNTFPDRYECQLVHFVRDLFELSDIEQTKGKIEKLLKEEHPIFKRIAIHTINRHYKDLNDLFWDWTGNPLSERWLKHEIYELLKSNCSSFNNEQIEKVLEWIESKEYYIPDEFKDDEEQKEKIKAYSKRKWLSALLESKNPKIINKYEEYTKINPAKIEHPSFDFWMGKTRIGSISPIEPGELLIKTNAEIAEYLNSFREEKGWEEPSKEGLSDALRKCMSDNPGKFSTNLEPFLNVHGMYQHSLLWGLWEAWRAKKTFEWDEILKFMLKIVESDSFWKEEEVTGRYNYRNQVISVIAELIEEGTKEDNHAFSPELLPEAEMILLILVEKTKSDLSEMKNLVTSVLNTSKGKIFSAMANYSLRYARLYRKEKEERWVESIKADFEKRLNREFESSLEFSFILGEYLANLYYLDKKWVINNINRIFPKDKEIYWKAAFTGYLSYSSRIYKEIYFLLRENEHYAKALKTDFREKHIAERLVQHICIGYIEGWGKLEDENSLIYKLIEYKDATQLSEIVNFFWRLRDKLTDKIKVKIKPLWKELFNKIVVPELVTLKLGSPQVETSEYQKVISELSKWLSLIDEIDDAILDWLKLSARYIEGFNTSFFIEYLLQHAHTEPEKVGEIYLEMLNAGVYPDYKKENIKDIVQTLYEKGQKEFADRICNMYGATGYDFLRELYKKYKGDKK